MHRVLLCALAAFSILGAASALADGPGDSHGYGRHHGTHYGHRWAMRRHHHHPRPARALRPEPVVDSGLVEYREAYIGRGLIYNVPPQPIYAAAYGHVIRARY